MGTAECHSPIITITSGAAQQILSLAATEGDLALMLRLTASRGGCSGFQYGFSLDSAVGKTDQVFENHGARIVVDGNSLSLLNGAQVDYLDGLDMK